MVTSVRPIDRRAFLTGLAGITAGVALGSPSLAARPLQSALFDRDQQFFASALKKPDGRFAISILDEAGQELAQVGLPDRGHGIAVSPDRQTLVAFARRPGTFALIIRPFDGSEPKLISSIKGRHFYGHGCFSSDGRLMYAAENDYEVGRGVIGIYDLSGQQVTRIGEFETFGIGPHEILLSGDQKTLIVANGGILTHPAKPREKLNLETMAPSIVFLDAKTGDLIAKHQIASDLHQLSLRHMAQDTAGRVWIGGQFEGPETQTPPLIATCAKDTPLHLHNIAAEIASGLQNYIGSVTANKDGSVIATSAPRGGKVLFWKADTMSFIGAQSIPDGCGIAPIDQQGFLISDGNGGLSYLDETPGSPLVLTRAHGTSWDNHMTAI